MGMLLRKPMTMRIEDKFKYNEGMYSSCTVTFRGEGLVNMGIIHWERFRYIIRFPDHPQTIR